MSVGIEAGRQRFGASRFLPVQLSIDLIGQIKKTNLNLCLEKVAVVAIKASAQTSA